MKHCIALLVFSFFLSSAFGQLKIDGFVLDGDDHTPLSGATIKLMPARDTLNFQGTAADDSGRFEFANLSMGLYILQFNYIGYRQNEQRVFLRDADKHLGQINLPKNATVLKDVNVTSTATRVTQKNDTAEYNAGAFKTGKDASVEDLVTKMPGITNENGTIKAQGEQVKKVLIDGKEYFGDDAQMAMKNMPSDIVDRVQVFDQMSDQSFFTGFDDGNSQKAMNIVTKKGMNQGVFGKVYAGYGYLTDSRYQAGASINYFNGNQRLSFVGMSNNINTQNFSSQDLLGISSGSSGRGGWGGGGPRGGGGRGAATGVAAVLPAILWWGKAMAFQLPFRQGLTTAMYSVKKGT